MNIYYTTQRASRALSSSIRFKPFLRINNVNKCLPISRTITTYSSPSSRLREAVIKARIQHPFLFPVLLIASAASVSLLGVLVYDEMTRVAPEYASYPKPVEQNLRMALHYTHVRPDPEAASTAFVKAIQEADANGMDPFGKESMGIRIRFAEMLEQFGYVKKAIEILGSITHDCETRLAEVDGNNQSIGISGSTPAAPNIRQVLLKLIIQTKVKISALYEGEYMQNPTLAKKTLSDAVGLLVKETADAQTNGISENNAAGFSTGEIAAIFSQMGDLYATSGEEANAVQVYMLTLQPLRAACNGTKSCKEVQVLSNIASTMTIAMQKPNAKINGKPATPAGLSAARKATLKWADQAIATAEKVLPEDRDEICELGLLSAQMTKAELLLGEGEKVKAKEVFQSLIPTLREKGLVTLVKAADEGLKRARS